MNHHIRTVYLVHHSHTDIGYTDLQETITARQADFIRSVVQWMQQPENQGFRWNCETLFCVERFLEQASDRERAQFAELARSCRIGLSGSYLNFTDLVDSGVLRDRLLSWAKRFAAQGIPFRTAMCADINGISMGQRDAMLDAGIVFLYMNIHATHGLYPLYGCQNAYLWEAADGRRLLVWNGEHYNLGNFLGIPPCRAAADACGQTGPLPDDFLPILHQNLDNYLSQCESRGYTFPFIISSVSGVFSDNAHPSLEILRMAEAYNARYQADGVQLRMVSLEELYQAILPYLQAAPVYRGDLNDWWANGVGSTPYPVKHYRAAQQRYALCRRLEPDIDAQQPILARTAQDNLLLYAEHTWGHSASVSDPYDEMVLDLELRKAGYASRAHEAASAMLNGILRTRGANPCSYTADGIVCAQNPSRTEGLFPVEFYIETPECPRISVLTAQGASLPCQVSAHPRGWRVTFLDRFLPGEQKQYAFRALPPQPPVFSRPEPFEGAEGIRDIENDTDPVTYKLPFSFENRFFRLRYAVGRGITELAALQSNTSLLCADMPLFTPVYEHTPTPDGADGRMRARGLRGRGCCGKNASITAAVLTDVTCLERGPVFTELAFRFRMPGSSGCRVVVRLYEQLARIDFRLELAKSLCEDMESVLLPLSVALPGSQVWLQKGTEAFRPGLDQLPGTCMDYSMSDDGVAFVSERGSVLITSPDVPLVRFGPLGPRPIRLCTGAPADNARPVWSWVMNNLWETNFKLDLSGFCAFRYSLQLSGAADGPSAMQALHELRFAPVSWLK